MNNKIEENFEDTIDFQKLFSTLQRWAWLFILCAILSAAAAYIFSRRQIPIYEATTNVLVTRNSQQQVADISQSLNITQLVETYSQMLSMQEFLDVVSEKNQYEVSPGSISVKALPNTQVIQLKVQDADPLRATQIADAMITVLSERNETLQSGRYNESEAALAVQAKEAENKITALQSKLSEAKDTELLKQIAEAQSNLNATLETIKITTLELERLDKMNWQEAHFLLYAARSNLVRQQTQFDQYIAELARLNGLVGSERAQTDPNYAKLLKQQIALYEKRTEAAKLSLEELQKEINFLTPLDGKKEFDSISVEKENALATQKSLRDSYQSLYTRLLSTAEVTRTTNEIDTLKKDLALYQQIYVDLLRQLEDVKKQKLQNTPTIEQVSPAIVGENPVKPRTPLNTILGGLAGLILAAAFVAVREMADDTIKSSEDVKNILSKNVLGYILEIKDESEGDGIYVTRFPRSPIAESFRSLRTHLGFTKTESPLKTIIVTSTAPSEGKTTIAANLAAVLAHSGKKVVLVDTDMRRPRVHKYIGISNELGLADLETVEDVRELLAYIQPLERTPALGVLPSGGTPENPADLISSDKMRDLIKVLAETYDHVVLDAPPMLVSDPHVLLGLADGVLLVMVPGKTRKDVVRTVAEIMQKTGVNILGVVFNRLKHGRKSGSGYEHYAYPYYYTSEYYYSENPETGAREKKKVKLDK